MTGAGATAKPTGGAHCGEAGGEGDGGRAMAAGGTGFNGAAGCTRCTTDWRGAKDSGGRDKRRGAVGSGGRVATGS
ncbi:MAG: PE family protein, partial [Oscillatoriales cyanobacterium SM2_1_8]|nr:PE family protein [Oscillatoriales cyanobacterium SM2_1_8]